MSGSAGRIRVAVADGRRLVREGVVALLSRHPRLQVRPLDLAAAGGNIDVIVLGTLDGVALPPDVPCVRLADVPDAETLVAGVLATAAQERPIPSGDERGPAAPSLTARERAVLRGVGRGQSAAEIGRELGISARTVDLHRSTMTAKLGAAGPARAVALSLAHGQMHEAG